MRKTLIFIILFSLLLSACNLPSQNQEPAGDSIATKVSASLTAEIDAAAPVATSVSSTLVAKTSEAASSQPDASDQQPTQEQPQPDASTQTATATPTPTETVTPTPTATPELGPPTLRNPMDSNVAFGLQTPYEDANSYFGVANGKMTMKSYSQGGYRGWRLTSQIPANAQVQGIFITQACSGQDQYGIVLRAPDYGGGYGYYIGITCDSQYRITRWNSSGVTSLATGSNPAILGGAGQTNTVKVLIEGDTIKLTVNDSLIHEVSDSAFADSGHYGVFVAAFSGGLVVDMDEIAYWKLP